MSILTAEQKQNLKPAINLFGLLLTCAVMIAFASKYVLSGYPPLVGFLEPFNELIILVGAILAGIVIYSKNKLIR